MKNRVDIIIPVYNERKNFETIFQCIRQNLSCDWRVVLVYDFEEDTTLLAARPLAGEDSRLELVHNRGQGVLHAMTTGFSHASADAVLVLMADDPPEIIEKIDELVEQFYLQQVAVAVASRYMRGGGHVGGPFLKGLLSRVAGVSLHFLIGLPTHDATYATRIYRKSFLDATPIESKKGFEIALELTLKAYFEGKKIIEIPVVWKERVAGDSRFNMRKWLPAYLRWYMWGLKKRFLHFI